MNFSADVNLQFFRRRESLQKVANGPIHPSKNHRKLDLILGVFLNIMLGRGLAGSGLAVPAPAWPGLAWLRLGLASLGLAWGWGWLGNDLVWLGPALYLNRTGPVLHLCSMCTR